MIVLIVFSFLAGIVTILSPCILPILPIVLSGSITGGKNRPLGVVAGFILSFTFFTLFLTTIVKATGVSADSLRTVSVVVILTFGLSLLIPKVQLLLEQLFSKLSSLVSPPKQETTNPSDFLSGVFVGLSLGLVWTPCVGPILASVISLALTGTITGSALLITLAYASGTAIPLLAVTYGGRQLLQKVPWLISNSATIRKIFGVFMILTAIGIYLNVDRKFQTYILEKFPNYGIGLTQLEDTEAVKNELEKIQNRPVDETKKGKPMYEMLDDNLGNAPEFIVGGQWFNIPEDKKTLSLTELRGKVVLVDFWTYTCINCIRTLPYLREWHKKYNSKGLTIVGVHTPEFEFEKNPDNVEKAIKDFALEYPIMQDNAYDTWSAYSNRYWPAKYLIDKNGNIRYTHFGEGKYDETEQMIQKLLAETGAAVDMPIDNPTYSLLPRTPELYLGHQRMEYLATPEQLVKNQTASYSFPNTIQTDFFAIAGIWTIGDERSVPQQGSRLILRFNAKNVFLVMRSTSGASRIKVMLDGKLLTSQAAGEDINTTDSTLTVRDDRLYKIIKLDVHGIHDLRLEFLDNNTELYAFTFG